jgi:hypothetical protein
VNLRHILRPALLVALTLAMISPAYAQHYTVDRSASDALTTYLHNHRLPLVGAEVLQGSGSQRVVLYGFVASDRGKQDAQGRALHYLGKSNAEIDNRIAVRPEIAQMGSPQTGSGAAAPSAADAANGPATGTSTKSFGQVLDEIQRYGIKTPPD